MLKYASEEALRNCITEEANKESQSSSSDDESSSTVSTFTEGLIILTLPLSFEAVKITVKSYV